MQSGRASRLGPGLVLLAIGWLVGVVLLSLQSPRAAASEAGLVPAVPVTRTLLPNDGVYIARLREFGTIQVITPGSTLYPDRTALADDTLATTIEVSGGHALVLIDVQTGEMQQVAYWGGVRVNQEIQLSGPYVVWQNEVSRSVVRLHVYDRELQQEVFTYDGLAVEVSAKDGLLVWRDYDPQLQHTTLDGYDLAAQTQFSVTVPMTVTIDDPRICSRQWLIYRYDTHYGADGTRGWASIRAHNLNTGEEVVVTERAYLPGAGGGAPHDCDGQWITWIEASHLTGGMFSQHVYDLATRTSRALDLPLSPVPAHPHISGSIVINEETGYDLLTGRSFSLPYGSRNRLVLWHDRIVWWTSPRAGESVVRLYVAAIERSP